MSDDAIRTIVRQIILANYLGDYARARMLLALLPG